MAQQNPDFDDETADRLASLGRGLLAVGIVLLVLRGLKLTTQMPGLISSWYSNQSLWVAVGLGLTGLGSWILWRTPQITSDSWQPGTPGRRFRTAVIFVGDECHLCDDAIALLSRYQQWLPNFDVVNINSDPELTNQYSNCVPVVVLDGKVRFRGRIQEALLRRLIEGTPATNSMLETGH